MAFDPASPQTLIDHEARVTRLEGRLQSAESGLEALKNPERSPLKIALRVLSVVGVGALLSAAGYLWKFTQDASSTAQMVRKTGDEQVARLEKSLPSDAPVGAVVAYAGPLGDFEVQDSDLPSVRAIRERIGFAGWLICDGGLLPTPGKVPESGDFTELFAVIGFRYGKETGDSGGRPQVMFRLPDYRGLFLRGVLGDRPTKMGDLVVDPDVDARAGALFEDVGMIRRKSVGSTQGFATALPRTSQFGTGASGDHTHQMNRRDNQTSQGGYGNALTGHPEFENLRGDGKHTHKITEGGDHETRPSNIYVHWLIKARRTPSVR